MIQVEGEIYWGVDTTAFGSTEPSSEPRGVILAILGQQWVFKNAKYKTLGENLNKKTANFFLLYKFSPRFLYFAFLNIHRWLKIANITPHGPDDGSVEPKPYSVDL